MQVGKDSFLHQLGMKCGNAVDGMRADEGEVAHAHPALAAFIDERDGTDLLIRHLLFLAGEEQRIGVDGVNDLHVPGQKALEQRHRPAFQRFRQKRVVGVGEGALCDLPGFVEFKAMDIAEKAHHFADGNGRMRVVKLDRNLVGQRGEIRVLLQMAAQNVLQRSGGEEELLPQAQFLTGRRRIGGVENPRQAFRLVAFAQCADMVAGIEGGQKNGIYRLRRPQAKRVDAGAAPADDRRVVSHGDDAFGRFPDEALRIFITADRLHRSAEADFIGAFAALEFPGVAMRQPGFRQFHLPSIRHLLAEEAVHVTDAIAIGGNIDGRHGFHETGGETAKAAIAKGCIRLQTGDDVKIDAERGQRIADFVHQADIGDGVAHQAADQEFERQVINALGIVVIGLAGGFHPFVDDAVADDEDGCGQPVVRLGDLDVLADAVGEAFDDFRRHDFRVGTARGGAGKIGGV
ncbi:hypothetical protein D3C86_1175340 [compost metagenome]